MKYYYSVRNYSNRITNPLLGVDTAPSAKLYATKAEAAEELANIFRPYEDEDAEAAECVKSAIDSGFVDYDGVSASIEEVEDERVAEIRRAIAVRDYDEADWANRVRDYEVIESLLEA